LGRIEQSILHNQKLIKLSIKLLFALLIFICSIFLFIGALSEFDSTSHSQDKFKNISSSIEKLECKEPKKSVKAPYPGEAIMLLRGAPNWLYIALHKIDNSKSCAELFSKIKLGQSINVMLRVDNMVVGQLEVENRIYFTHSDYVKDQVNVYQSSKWIYLIVIFISFFYITVKARRLFT
jgi:hypothetical protein